VREATAQEHVMIRLGYQIPFFDPEIVALAGETLAPLFA